MFQGKAKFLILLFAWSVVFAGSTDYADIYGQKNEVLFSDKTFVERSQDFLTNTEGLWTVNGAWRNNKTYKNRLRRASDNEERDFYPWEYSNGRYLSGELVENGDFSDGITGWSSGSGANLSVVSGQLEVSLTSPDAFGNANQELSLEIGNYYKAVATKISQTGVGQWLVSTTQTGPVSVLNFGVTTTGVVTGIFQASQVTNYIQLGVNTDGGTSVYDNLSVRKYQPSTAETWAAGTNAYVVKEYDQSGQGKDRFNTTAANQPLLIENGALREDGPYYDATDLLTTDTGEGFNCGLNDFAGAMVVGLDDYTTASPYSLFLAHNTNINTFLLIGRTDGQSLNLFTYDNTGGTLSNVVVLTNPLTDTESYLMLWWTESRTTLHVEFYDTTGNLASSGSVDITGTETINIGDGNTNPATWMNDTDTVGSHGFAALYELDGWSQKQREWLATLFRRGLLN